MASPVVETFSGPTFEDTLVDDKLTLTTPAGTVQNEWLIAQFASDNAGAAYPADDDSDAGWIKFIERGFSAVSCALYRLKAPASPAATYTFTTGGASVMGGGMLRISGADLTVPIDVSDSAEGNTDASVDCPNVPTNEADALVLRFFAADDNDYSSADSGYPAGHTGLYADETTLGNDMSIGAAHIDQAGIGDTGIGRFTGMSPQEQWVAFTVAISLLPAPSETTVTISNLNTSPFFLGGSYTIDGSGFEAVKGTGSVKISPTDNVADAGAVVQTDTSWDNGLIAFTLVQGALSLDTNVYLFVINDSGDSNAAGFVMQLVPEYILEFAEPVRVIFNITFSQIPAPPPPLVDMSRNLQWFFGRW